MIQVGYDLSACLCLGHANAGNKASSKMPIVSPVVVPTISCPGICVQCEYPFQGQMLVLVNAQDRHLIQMMTSITSTKMVKKLWVIFTDHGLPCKVVTDNGSSFTSESSSHSCLRRELSMLQQLLTKFIKQWSS